MCNMALTVRSEKHNSICISFSVNKPLTLQYCLHQLFFPSSKVYKFSRKLFYQAKFIHCHEKRCLIKICCIGEISVRDFVTEIAKYASFRRSFVTKLQNMQVLEL